MDNTEDFIRNYIRQQLLNALSDYNVREIDFINSVDDISQLKITFNVGKKKYLLRGYLTERELIDEFANTIDINGIEGLTHAINIIDKNNPHKINFLRELFVLSVFSYIDYEKIMVDQIPDIFAIPKLHNVYIIEIIDSIKKMVVNNRISKYKHPAYYFMLLDWMEGENCITSHLIECRKFPLYNQYTEQFLREVYNRFKDKLGTPFSLKNDLKQLLLDVSEFEKLERYQTLLNEYIGAASTAMERAINFLDSSNLPDVLLHGDFHPGNVLISTPANRMKIAMIDWEYTSIGPFIYDAIYYVIAEYIYSKMNMLPASGPSITPIAAKTLHQYLKVRLQATYSDMNPFYEDEFNIYDEGMILDAINSLTPAILAFWIRWYFSLALDNYNMDTTENMLTQLNSTLVNYIELFPPKNY